MYLFRIHIRPKGGSADMQTTFDYCRRNHILGVGWRTNSGKHTKDWDVYFKEASKIHDGLKVCEYIHKRVGKSDLVWTRSPPPVQYYLARVKSGWEYWTSAEARRHDIDIANIFRCDQLLPVQIDDVPGKVVICFRAPRTIQEIADSSAVEYSKCLWNRLSGTDAYSVDVARFRDIFMMLSAEETEDLMFLYLQSLGWYVVPSSRKADTMSFEYLLVNPKTGERAQAQVKTGNESITLDAYSGAGCTVFLFQSNDLYTGRAPQNVNCVWRRDLDKFLKSSPDWLPC